VHSRRAEAEAAVVALAETHRIETRKPAQLRLIGFEEVAAALEASMRAERSLEELEGDLGCLSRYIMLSSV